MGIFFHQLHKKPVPEKRLLKEFIPVIFRQFDRKIESINIILCSDKYLLDLNRSALKHDYYTDVITYDLSNKATEISGDIYISNDRVSENAKNFKLSFKKEVHRVIFHACLHLCGLSDKVASEKAKMTSLEDSLLQKFNKFVLRRTNR